MKNLDCIRYLNGQHMVTPLNTILIQLSTIDNKISAAYFVVNHQILLKYASFMEF